MHDSHAAGEFLGLDLGQDRPPNETTICRFRHLLEEHELGKRILEIVCRRLEPVGLRVYDGMIVDATIIHLPQKAQRSRRKRREGKKNGARNKQNQNSLRPSAFSAVKYLPQRAQRAWETFSRDGFDEEGRPGALWDGSPA